MQRRRAMAAAWKECTNHPSDVDLSAHPNEQGPLVGGPKSPGNPGTRPARTTKRAFGARARTKGLQQLLGAFLRTKTVRAAHWWKYRQTAQPWAGSAELFARYMTTAIAAAGAISVSFKTGCGRRDCNQPAESHARGITNSDQPQSRQTRMSGEGVIGG